jgi:hypothetical protein
MSAASAFAGGLQPETAAAAVITNEHAQVAAVKKRVKLESAATLTPRPTRGKQARRWSGW